MSSISSKNAEQLFREAFERLKANRPVVIERNSPMSQNNVAREAGSDPSALKKDRYPILVLEIQAFIAHQHKKIGVKERARDNRSRTSAQMLKDCQNQRDKLSSIIAAQNTLIEELLDEIEELKSNKILRIK